MTHAFNHWEKAVDTHGANHPSTEVDITDLHEVHPACYPRMDVLLGSPECRTHTGSSGRRRKGLNQMDFFDQCELSPRDVKSRATMWRWSTGGASTGPIVVVENVVDVNYWAPLPQWLAEFERMDYEVQKVYVSAMHVHGLVDERIKFTTPQSRDRVYFVFNRKGMVQPDMALNPPAPCPRCACHVSAVQSWKDTKIGRRRWGKYRTQYLYTCPTCATAVEPYTFAASNIIDYSIPGIRIGDREKLGMRPLSEKTIARIEYGLRRFGLQRYNVDLAYSHRGPNVAESMSKPLSTQTTAQTRAMVYANRTNSTINGDDEPTHTQSTGGNLALLTIHRGTSKSQPDHKPLPAVTGGAINHGLVTGGAYPTQPSALLTLRGGRSLSPMTDTLASLVSAQQIGTLSTHPFLVQYNGTGTARSTADALPAVTTRDRNGLCVPDSSAGASVWDLFFRMLMADEELKPGGGFPESYVLLGTNRDKVKLIGNSNSPSVENWIMLRVSEAAAASCSYL